MPQSILITGATGTIGSALTQSLIARGADFAIMTSQSEQATGFPAVQGDFRRPETLTAAFQGVDTLFLLTPLAPDMLALTRNVIAAAQAAGVKHIVRSSGAGADADSPYSLAREHGEANRLLQASGLQWTILCPNFFMQNYLSYYRDQIVAGIFHAPQGNGAVSLIDVRDIADCAAAVLADPSTHRNRIYNLTGGEALTNSEQMATISKIIGRTVRYVDVPDSAAIAGMNEMGMPPLVVDWMMSLNATVKAGHAGFLSDDVHTLSGHPPRRFADFVAEHAAAWR